MADNGTPDPPLTEDRPVLAAQTLFGRRFVALCHEAEAMLHAAGSAYRAGGWLRRAVASVALVGAAPSVVEAAGHLLARR